MSIFSSRRRHTRCSLAAGASQDIEASQITVSKTGKLAQITVGSSSAIKAEIKTRDGVSVSTMDVIYNSQASPTREWRPPHRDWVTQVGGTNRNFRLTVTNLDTTQAADAYASFYWDEV